MLQTSLMLDQLLWVYVGITAEEILQGIPFATSLSKPVIAKHMPQALAPIAFVQSQNRC